MDYEGGAVSGHLAGSHGGRWGSPSVRVRYGTLSEGRGEAKGEYDKRTRPKMVEGGREGRQIERINN